MDPEYVPVLQAVHVATLLAPRTAEYVPVPQAVQTAELDAPVDPE
jgi:hypothetical protein